MSTPPTGTPGGDPKAVAIRVHESALPPGEPFFVDGDTELLGDGVDVSDIQMDQGVRPSVTLVLGQVEADVAPSHRDEPWEARLELANVELKRNATLGLKQLKALAGETRNNGYELLARHAEEVSSETTAVAQAGSAH